MGWISRARRITDIFHLFDVVAHATVYIEKCRPDSGRQMSSVSYLITLWWKIHLIIIQCHTLHMVSHNIIICRAAEMSEIFF